MMNAMFGGLGLIFMILYLGLLGLGIYCTVLFIKLALRGIRALDIYIDKNQSNNNDNQ
ncbi:MAG: hypothetical protein ACOZCL_01225 [Bacillota bacterium]